MYSFIVFLSDVRYFTYTDTLVVNSFILNEFNMFYALAYMFCNHNLLIRLTSGCLDGSEEWTVTAKG